MVEDRRKLQSQDKSSLFIFFVMMRKKRVVREEELCKNEGKGPERE